MTALLHCPFCGAPTECEGPWPTGRELNDWWETRCDNDGGCGASMIAPTRELVIERWNARASGPMEIRHVTNNSAPEVQS